MHNLMFPNAVYKSHSLAILWQNAHMPRVKTKVLIQTQHVLLYFVGQYFSLHDSGYPCIWEQNKMSMRWEVTIHLLRNTSKSLRIPIWESTPHHRLLLSPFSPTSLFSPLWEEAASSPSTYPSSAISLPFQILFGNHSEVNPLIQKCKSFINLYYETFKTY